MTLRSFIRMSVTVSVVMLCMAFAAYSYLRLHAADRAKDFNLYSLVPSDAVAVVETERMADLINEIDEMQCSKDGRFLYVSELFTYLKNYLASWVDDAPHGLSKQMNKMLISFHQPDNAMNQVLYCTLGAEDGSLVEAFIQKYASESFPPKIFKYEGESIYIYPLNNGRFLAAYFTPDFLVVSFQKRLVEQVIDTYRSRKSLLMQPAFRHLYHGSHAHASATVYLRMKSVDMGKAADSTQMVAPLGCWAEFDLKFGERVVYCTGMTQGSDSAFTFINAMRRQEPVEGFYGNRLPSSTFFYNCWALSDKPSVFAFTSQQEYAKTTYADDVKVRDDEWKDFLLTYGGDRVMSCLFLSKDTADHYPCAVMRMPMSRAAEAEAYLRIHAQCSSAHGLRHYLLPNSTVLTQLTGITESAFSTVACFYKGDCLLAPDVRSLRAYIDALEQEKWLEGMPRYEELTGSLSPTYNFVWMADMETMAVQPASYVRLIPSFFFRHIDFFRHFLVAVQFTYAEGMVYPNIVLLYK